MNNWIKAVRLKITIIASLLVIVSFKISHWDSVAFIIATFIIIVASATMAHNDWRDRFHDAKKGKDFALIKSISFFKFVVCLWLISFILAIVLLKINILFGLLSFAIIVAGLVYSETRKIPFIPAIIVAITSASPSLYPVIIFEQSKSSWLFMTILLLIFGREILKDLDDVNIDNGYKWTLPIAIGIKRTKIITGIIIIFVPIIALNISFNTLIGAPLLLISAISLIMGGNHKFAKTTADLAMIQILIVLLLFSS